MRLFAVLVSGVLAAAPAQAAGSRSFSRPAQTPGSSGFSASLPEIGGPDHDAPALELGLGGLLASPDFTALLSQAAAGAEPAQAGLAQELIGTLTPGQEAAETPGRAAAGLALLDALGDARGPVAGLRTLSARLRAADPRHAGSVRDVESLAARLPAGARFGRVALLKSGLDRARAAGPEALQDFLTGAFEAGRSNGQDAGVDVSARAPLHASGLAPSLPEGSAPLSASPLAPVPSAPAPRAPSLGQSLLAFLGVHRGPYRELLQPWPQALEEVWSAYKSRPADAQRPFVIALAGAIGVGKSAFGYALHELFAQRLGAEDAVSLHDQDNPDPQAPRGKKVIIYSRSGFQPPTERLPMRNGPAVDYQVYLTGAEPMRLWHVFRLPLENAVSRAVVLFRELPGLWLPVRFALGALLFAVALLFGTLLQGSWALLTFPIEALGHLIGLHHAAAEKARGEGTYHLLAANTWGNYLRHPFKHSILSFKLKEDGEAEGASPR